ncbi:N-acetylmuramoyl-L-alanine amidase [Cyanothece sp. BG0011]|uniref:N-acetylmuramoyl-L-alanine amidase n=1 Tax=Cyanothece sp. BG0011 TaxID=2082950 RepID=UPI000D1DE060|nr:N-acetylmuramoyl-L-alanine amidase [Cyanothece sp. BG0011]
MTSRQDLGERLNLEIDWIPESNSNRPGTIITPRFITIHNTDNENPGADARAHATYIKGTDAQNRQVSWHYTVDDQRCIKHLPVNEKGWHAGSRDGNNQSIGIEICMHQGIDQNKANERAATLTAILMYDLNISIDHLVTHQHWTGKNCPRRLLGEWDSFKQQVQAIYNRIEPRREAIATLFSSEALGDWLAGHGKADERLEQPAFCHLPPVPERPLQENIDPNRAFLVRYSEKKWVNHTVLHYHFLDTPLGWRGDATQKQAVRDAFAQWKGLPIGLEFQEVNDPSDAEIRIGFENGGSWSYVGRDAIDYAPNPQERTMNFGWDLTTPYGRDTALHEIGHALGFPHEHQNPLAGIVWDEETVYRTFAEPPNRWDRDTTYHNIIRKISPSLVEGSTWDKDSIMHYNFPAGLIISPSQYQTQPLIPEPGLSPTDRQEAKRFYPDDTPRPIELKPYLSAIVDVDPGEQLDFTIKPQQTRDYTIETIGHLDSVIVLFEDVNGTSTYVNGDDDSGFDRNARMTVRLIKDKTYYLRIRLYYASASGKGAVIFW